MVMIGDHGEREARVLCLPGIADQIQRAMLFAGKFIPNF
jgi:hypothetical protein